MMKKYRIKKSSNFSELHLPDMILRRQHLTDDEVSRLQVKYPSTFHNHFEEIPPPPPAKADQEEGAKSKSKK